MTKCKVSKDGRNVELDGEIYKIKYNETSAMLKKREVKKGGIAEIARQDFCGEPKKLQQLLDDGWSLCGKAHNWKHLVQEKHNLGNGINKRRKELNLQADGINGEGVISTDDMNDKVNAVSSATGETPAMIKEVFQKMGTWGIVLLAGLSVVAISLIILAIKAKIAASKLGMS